eukprot:512172_1
MSWNIAPQMQTARRSHSCIIHPNNHVLYSIGGVSIHSFSSNIEKISMVNIDDNKWTYLNGSLSNHMKGLRSFITDNIVMIIGGIDQSRTMYDTIHVIDTITDIVTVSDMKLAFPTVYSATIMVNHVMYSFGGGFGVDIWQSHTIVSSDTIRFLTTTPTLTSSATKFTNISGVVTTMMTDTDGQKNKLTIGPILGIVFGVALFICFVIVITLLCVQDKTKKKHFDFQDIETGKVSTTILNKQTYEQISENNKNDIQRTNDNKSVYDEILTSQNDGWKTNIITKNEVSKHKEKCDCWIIIDDVIYDVSDFLPKHPVSSLFIMRFAGQDCSDEMRAVGHSEWAYKLADSMRVGMIPQHERNSEQKVQDQLQKQYSIINWKKLELFGVSIQQNENNTFFVQALNIYPVKGLKGIPIKSSVVINGGFLNDR